MGGGSMGQSVVVVPEITLKRLRYLESIRERFYYLIY